MKKLVAWLALAGVLTLLPAEAASADTSSTGPSVVGGGTAGTIHFAFSARLGPNGPSGYAVVRDPTLGEAQGPVVCVRQTTVRQVVFYIQTKKGNGYFGSGLFVGMFALDSGAAPPTGDFFLAARTFGVGSCVLDGGFGGPVTQGNIVFRQ